MPRLSSLEHSKTNIAQLAVPETGRTFEVVPEALIPHDVWNGLIGDISGFLGTRMIDVAMEVAGNMAMLFPDRRAEIPVYEHNFTYGIGKFSDVLKIREKLPNDEYWRQIRPLISYLANARPLFPEKVDEVLARIPNHLETAKARIVNDFNRSFPRPASKEAVLLSLAMGQKFDEVSPEANFSFFMQQMRKLLTNRDWWDQKTLQDALDDTLPFAPMLRLYDVDRGPIRSFSESEFRGVSQMLFRIKTEASYYHRFAEAARNIALMTAEQVILTDRGWQLTFAQKNDDVNEGGPPQQRSF